MGWIYTIVFAAVSYWYMKKIRKETSDESEGLANDQKIFVPLLVFMNPIVNGLIFYLGWKKQLPKKAKAANNWALGIFLVAFVLYGAYFWYQMHYGEATEPWREAGEVMERNSAQETANLEAQAVLSGLRPETINYYGEGDTYTGLCEALPGMDVLLPGSSFDAQPVLASASCVSSEDAFAVSVSGATESYCISANAESLLPDEAQVGHVAQSEPISCVEATSTAPTSSVSEGQANDN